MCLPASSAVLAASIELVSGLPEPASQAVTANGASASGCLAGHSRYVYFVSEASDLVRPALSRPKANVYRRDLTTGATLLVTAGLDGKGLSEHVTEMRPSDDGLLVAYTTAAANVVANDFNEARDLFVYNANTGATTLVSASADGSRAAERGVIDFDFSGDGRWLAFTSSSTNLAAPSPGPASINVYLYDRETKNTVSAPDSDGFVAANGLPHSPQISSDGRVVVFHSHFVPTTSLLQRTSLLAWKRADNSVTRISLPGERSRPSGVVIPIYAETLSSNGEALFLRTIDRVVEDDPGLVGLYRVEVATGESELIQAEPEGLVRDTALYLSMAGDTAAFTTKTTEGAEQVRIWSRASGVKTLAELASGEAQDPASSEAAGLSPDGRWLALGSDSAVPSAGIAEAGDRRVFAWELATGQARVLARQEDPALVVFSNDGSQAVFTTDEPLDGPRDRNELTDVFLAEVSSGARTTLSLANSESPSATPLGLGSAALAVSDDGRYVAFQSDADGLVPGDNNGTRDLFIHDRQTKSNRLVRINQPGHVGFGLVRFRQLSSDGQHVLFWSQTDEIGQYGFHLARQYIWNLATGETEQAVDLADLPEIAPPLRWTGHVYEPDAAQMSRDGRYVIVRTSASNGPSVEVLLRDRWTGKIIALFNQARQQRAGVVQYLTRQPVLSPDGKTVIFGSLVYHTATGIFDDLYPPGTMGLHVNKVRFSEDGRYAWIAERWESDQGLWVYDTSAGTGAAWSSPANYVFAWAQAVVVGNEVIVPARSSFDASLNLYRIELFGSALQPLLTTIEGQPVNGLCRSPSVSADGRWILFTSFASNLAPNDTNAAADVFALDRWTGEVTCVSRDGQRGDENVAAAGGILSADGRVAVFATFGDSLVANDHNGAADVVAVALADEPWRDSDADGLPDGWERTWWNSLAATANDDADADGQSNIDEWRARTSPRQSSSQLQVGVAPAITGAPLRLHWAGRPGVSYQVQSRDKLLSALDWVSEGPAISGRSGELSTDVPADATKFYRVMVNP